MNSSSRNTPALKQNIPAFKYEVAVWNAFTSNLFILSIYPNPVSANVGVIPKVTSLQVLFHFLLNDHLELQSKSIAVFLPTGSRRYLLSSSS